jgi:hypothetical protein
MSRIGTILITLLVIFAGFTHSASAGGWATVEFDALPENIQTGDTVTVRFLVRQHGENPVHTAFGETLVATVLARTSPNSKPITVEATPDKEVGYYTAQLTFPEQGQYELSVMTNLLYVEEVESNRVNVPVSVARAPAPQPLVAGASASASSIAPTILFAVIGIVFILGVGTVAILRTR